MSIIYFTKYWPIRNRNAARERSISLIQSLCNMNKNVVVCSPDLNQSDRKIIEQYPVSLVDISSKKIGNSLNFAHFKPTHFIFDSVQMQQNYSIFMYNKWNKLPRILDLNKFTKLQQWRKNNYSIIKDQIYPLNASMAPKNHLDIFTENQIRSINRSDYIISANQFSSYLIQNQLNKKQSSYCAFGYPSQQFYLQVQNLQYRPFRNRENFVYFGNRDNDVSLENIKCLVENIWPLIKKQLPQVNLHIYGTGKFNPFTQKKQYLKQKGIYIEGKLQDLEDLSKFKALLYPNKYSTGQHLKVKESWFHHLPVITTPIGAQGLFIESLYPNLDLPKEGNRNSFLNQRTLTSSEQQNRKKINQIYDKRKISKKINQLKFGGSCANFSFEDFAKSAIRIYNDEEYWNECLKNGHNYIKYRENDQQQVNTIKSILVKAERAVYEGRKSSKYIQQWKKITKSPDFLNKLNKKY